MKQHEMSAVQGLGYQILGSMYFLALQTPGLSDGAQYADIIAGVIFFAISMMSFCGMFSAVEDKSL